MGAGRRASLATFPRPRFVETSPRPLRLNDGTLGGASEWLCPYLGENSFSSSSTRFGPSRAPARSTLVEPGRYGVDVPMNPRASSAPVRDPTST